MAGPAKKQLPRAAVWWMRAFLGAAGVVALGLVGVDPATLGLSVAAAALIFCLTALYRMVRVLGRPAVQFDLERDATVAAAGAKHLRDEKRRLLRAINELEFDHKMGKISEADYKTVRHGYELRAVEVMRELEGASTLHPALRRELQARGLVEGDEEEQPAGEREPEHDAKARTCAACKGANDEEAKFCKHCGKELAA